MLNRLVEYVQENRLSTTEVADAMNKSGVLNGVQALNRGHHQAGPIFPVFAANGSNLSVHEQIVEVPAGAIVVIFVENCKDRAIIGELMARYLLLYRRARAVVVDGLVRDAARLYRENFAVWAGGITPLGCVNAPARAFDPTRQEELETLYRGGLAVCDDGGVVLAPRNWMNADLLERFERIEMQEDLWSFCVNSLKWNTKKTVCDKAYFENDGCLPDLMRINLNKLKKGFSL